MLASISPLVSQLKMESDPHLLGFGFTVRVTSLHSKVRAGNFSGSGKEEGGFANDCIDTDREVGSGKRRKSTAVLDLTEKFLHQLGGSGLGKR